MTADHLELQRVVDEATESVIAPSHPESDDDGDGIDSETGANILLAGEVRELAAEEVAKVRESLTGMQSQTTVDSFAGVAHRFATRRLDINCGVVELRAMTAKIVDDLLDRQPVCDVRDVVSDIGARLDRIERDRMPSRRPACLKNNVKRQKRRMAQCMSPARRSDNLLNPETKRQNMCRTRFVFARPAQSESLQVRTEPAGVATMPLGLSPSLQATRQREDMIGSRALPAPPRRRSSASRPTAPSLSTSPSPRCRRVRLKAASGHQRRGQSAQLGLHFPMIALPKIKVQLDSAWRMDMAGRPVSGGSQHNA